MVSRLIGRKLGMTQIYDEKGNCLPVTVIEAGPCTVTQVKTKEIDGYNALQISFGQRKTKNINRAQLGHVIAKPEDGKDKDADRKKQLDKGIRELKFAPERYREIPWDGKEEIKRGDTLTVSVFENQKKIDIEGHSKGRGFMGVIRHWGYHRQPATRGCSDRERAPGSLIGGQEGGKAGHVVKGKKMPGDWGNEQVTTRNLDIVKIAPIRMLFVIGRL